MKTITGTVLLLAVGSVLCAQDVPPPRIILQQPIGEARPGVVTSSTAQFVAGELAGGSPVKGAPYSAQAVSQITQTLADGNRIVHNTSSMIYRDSEGRERREVSFPGLSLINGTASSTSEPQQTVFISDPVAGMNYALETRTRSARKMPMPPAPPPDQKPPSGDVMFQTLGVTGAMIPTIVGSPQLMIFQSNGQGNGAAAPKIEQLGTMTIEGVQAEGTRTTTTIPAGQIGNDQPIQTVSERWYSPELKVTVLTKTSDPRMGETTYALKNVSRSEPAQSLFTVPSDYSIVEPPSFGPQFIQRQ